MFVFQSPVDVRSYTIWSANCARGEPDEPAENILILAFSNLEVCF